MKLKWLRTLSWRTLVAGLLAGGIIHICATFAIPYMSPASAYKTLVPQLPLNQLIVAPPITPENQLLPFMTPDVRYALCRFNIHSSPVAVKARLLNPSWTLALYTSTGDNFYIVSGLTTRRLDVTFDLVPPNKRFLGIFPVSQKIVADRTTVPVPEKAGLLIIRAPISGTAYSGEVDQSLKLASCRPVER